MISTYLGKDDEFNEICNIYDIDSKKCHILDRILCGENEHIIFSIITNKQEDGSYNDVYHFIRPAYSTRPFEFIMRKNGQEILRLNFEKLSGYCGKYVCEGAVIC